MIHPTAVVDPSVKIGAGVSIGAFSVIGAHVEIGDACAIGPHVVIQGPTRIGRDTRIFQFASIGADPQDKKFHGENSELILGERNMIREFVTINRGTAEGGGATRIGDDNWIMAYVHIAHDCQVGSNTVFSNGATLAGHVEVGDHVIFSGYSGAHQFCRIGSHAFLAMGTHLNGDLPPFMLAGVEYGRPRGINSEGSETPRLFARAHRRDQTRLQNHLHIRTDARRSSRRTGTRGRRRTGRERDARLSQQRTASLVSMTTDASPLFVLVAGEASGDLLGADLIGGLRKKFPGRALCRRRRTAHGAPPAWSCGIRRKN